MWCLLITLANRLDPDQARQNIRPGSDPNCFDTLMVFLAEIFKNSWFWKISRRQKKTCKFIQNEKLSVYHWSTKSITYPAWGAGSPLVPSLKESKKENCNQLFTRFYHIPLFIRLIEVQVLYNIYINRNFLTSV